MFFNKTLKYKNKNVCHAINTSSQFQLAKFHRIVSSVLFQCVGILRPSDCFFALLWLNFLCGQSIIIRRTAVLFGPVRTMGGRQSHYILLNLPRMKYFFYIQLFWGIEPQKHKKKKTKCLKRVSGIELQIFNIILRTTEIGSLSTDEDVINNFCPLSNVMDFLVNMAYRYLSSTKCYFK